MFIGLQYFGLNSVIGFFNVLYLNYWLDILDWKENFL